jgi:hypothetical protein
MSNINRRITALQAIQRAAGVMGLVQPSTAVGNSDALVTQWLAILNELGQDLLEEPGGWQFMKKTYSLVTAYPTLVYSFPSDFDSFVTMTGWNQTARIPLIGPLSEQEWQLLKARQLGGTTLRLQYRIAGDQLEFYYLPTAAQTLAISYKSRGWVQDATTSTTFKDLITADGDVLEYDPRMLITGLIYKWREAKGFDTTSSGANYLAAKNAAKNADVPGNDVRLDSGNSAFPYLGYLNMADTNFGT